MRSCPCEMRQPSVTKRRDARDQANRFAHIRGVRVSFRSLIERAEHRDAGAQHIHRMRVLRHQPHHLHDRLRQRALGGDLLREIRQLTAVGQFAVQEADKRLPRSSPSPPSRGCRNRDTSARRWDRPSRSLFRRRSRRPVPGCKLVLFHVLISRCILTSFCARTNYQLA